MFLQEFEQQQQQRLKKTKIGSKISNPWQDQFIELGREKLVLTWHTISALSRESGLVSNLLILGMREARMGGRLRHLGTRSGAIALPDSGRALISKL